MVVPATLRAGPTAFFSRLLGVAVRPRTYLNALYVGLLFPLGLGYFVALSVGLALSISLSFVLIGIPLFVVLLFTVRELTVLERALAEYLLGADVRTSGHERPEDAVGHLKRIVISPATWRGVVFLASKFALGIAAFVLLVFLGSFAAAFLLVPLYYRRAGGSIQFISVPESVTLTPTIAFELQTWEVGLTVPFRITSWYVDTFPEALGVSLIGVLIAIASMHLLNAVAFGLRRFAEFVLRDTHPSEIVCLARRTAEN